MRIAWLLASQSAGFHANL